GDARDLRAPVPGGRRERGRCLGRSVAKGVQMTTGHGPVGVEERAAELLEAAIELIEDRGVARNGSYRETIPFGFWSQRYCAVGSLYASARLGYVLNGYATCDDADLPAVQRAIRALAEVIDPEAAAAAAADDPEQIVWKLNDETGDDETVLRVMRAAAATLRRFRRVNA